MVKSSFYRLYSNYRFLVPLLSILLLVTFSCPAHCDQKQFKVTNVKNVVRIDGTLGKEYKDYFVRLGEGDGCVARLISVEDWSKEPLPEHDTVMLGDIVTLTKGVKKPEVKILPKRMLFDFYKYDLKKEARQALNKLAKKIKKSNYKNKRIKLSSHTDSIGSNEYNMWLSDKRAGSIYNYLVNTHKLLKKSLA